jgi:predicted nucleic acid-binding protein
MIVVDASVAAKWFLPEAGSDEATQLLSGTDKLIAPDLIRVEVAAAITRRVRLGELLEDEAMPICHAWLKALSDGVITLTPVEDDLAEAIKLALEIKHPLQDCLYLAVAIRLKAVLITSDPKFIERSSALYPLVRRLD